MIQVGNINVCNINNAILGIRNPMNSWDNSDSNWDNINKVFVIGENDLTLAQKLINAGTDESKFMRQIFISMNIEAPLFWWKEMDQYRIGCTTNSCSTMHKLASTPITLNCFSFDNENLTKLDTEEYLKCKHIINSIIENCEWLRKKYLETKDKRYWRELIQILPSAWNQKRTWTANYQVLRNIYFARRNHKLQEWKDFCNLIEKLPYGLELICYKKGE